MWMYRLYLITTALYWNLSDRTGQAFDIRKCNEALGMESGSISDDSITASSSYVSNVGPKNGRLRVEKAGGGWCPKQPIEKGVREFIEIDLKEVHVITGVQTQGRYDRGRGQEYVEEYLLEYWRPGLEEWKEYKRWDGKHILRGNSDTASVEMHKLMPTIFASKIRLLPYSIHRRTVCLRMELLGCVYAGGIIAYTAPVSEDLQGLYDASYDGHRSQGMLSKGLGRLVDGEVGLDNFRLDIGYGKGNGWVAWKNSSFDTGYLELIFEFDQIRNFTSMHLFTNNFFSRNVQVFSKAKILFSIGGKFYNGAILSFSYMPDKVLENARNVSINLHYRIARFVKVRLYFADQYIMLSEVLFESVPIFLNITEEEDLDLQENEVIITSNGDKMPKTFETIAAKKTSDAYVEVIIGVLTAIMLLLLVVFLVILIINKRHKLQGSPTLFRNPFGMKINMKDLLMNFSSSSGQNNANQSIPITPISHPDSLLEPVTPMTYEEYRNSLQQGGNFYPTNYTTLSTIEPPPIYSSDMGDEEEEIPPEVPPLPDSPELQNSITPLNNHNAMPVNYRSLQSTPTLNSNSKGMNFGNYLPRENGGDRGKKFYTAPREKHRVSPPIVCWNIVPSMGQPYSNKEVELVSIPRYCLRPVEKLGSCPAGGLSLYEIENLYDVLPDTSRLVAVRTSNPDKFQGDAMECLREIRLLAGLNDANICRVLGVCAAEQPPWTIIEYGEMGDLAQYLQFLVNRNGSIRPSEDQPISTASLIYMATQIASAMKYLESKNVVHKDLAARNCLVGRGYIIKITDIAMAKPQYRKEYAEIGGRPPAPLRWLPWESILLDRYSCSSTVWAFAVTLWEILNFCCERPFGNLSNEKVIQNAEHMYYGGELQVMLSKPPHCTTDIYDLMCSCWSRDDTDRPTFKSIYSFLKRINKDYVPTD
ncbi:discoidin domain-containing receptor 2-like isoform X2 [Anthonomus grandis grandis]|uniref:discoidin domain-containing receptor 2-like isoform X2 n=1 Tax=Anthonomus grandis grandis TaxID=2921223 RepID=UPI002165B192|nr:discoidin domain-containing receptor 2-like isoform X2 [Anthonomus grandis grandis]